MFFTYLVVNIIKYDYEPVFGIHKGVEVPIFRGKFCFLALPNVIFCAVRAV